MLDQSRYKQAQSKKFLLRTVNMNKHDRSEIYEVYINYWERQGFDDFEVFDVEDNYVEIYGFKRQRAQVYRARIKLIETFANGVPDEKNRRLFRNGFIPERYQSEFSKSLSVGTDGISKEPLSFAEITSYSTWFAMHPEKMAGYEKEASSIQFPVKLIGNRKDIEAMIAKVFPDEKKDSEAEALAMAIALEIELELLNTEGLNGLQEYITTYKRKDKNGKTYYYQIIEKGIKGDADYSVIWEGRASQSDWNWNKSIAEEQTDRCIINEKEIICIKN